MAPSFDTCGWFARGEDVELFAEVGKVLLGNARGPSPVGKSEKSEVKRVLLGRDVFDLLDSSHASTLEDALRKVLETAACCRSLVAQEVVVTPPSKTLSEWWDASFRIIQGWEIQHSPEMVPFVRAHAPEITLAAGIQERMDIAAGITAEEVEEAMAQRRVYTSHMHSLLSPGTILCIPTAPCTAPPPATPHSEVVAVAGAVPSAVAGAAFKEKEKAAAERMANYRRDIMAMTTIAGLSGLPEITLPLVRDGELGHPLGLSFVGWSGADEVLLQLALDLGSLLLQHGIKAGAGSGAVPDKGSKAAPDGNAEAYKHPRI
jgi:amidase